MIIHSSSFLPAYCPPQPPFVQHPFIYSQNPNIICNFIESLGISSSDKLIDLIVRCFDFLKKELFFIKTCCANFFNRHVYSLASPSPQVASDVCQQVGKTGLCFQSTILAPGVSHHVFAGNYEGQPQRMQILEVDPKTAVLRVQHAKGVLLRGEAPSTGRISLEKIAARVPGTVGGISGGFFHYNPPNAEYYIWPLGPHSSGDPVGEVIANGEQISSNPNIPHWGTFSVGSDGRVSIDKNAPKNALHALGGAPILIQNGQLIKEFGHPLSLQRNQVATPGVFQYHMDRLHGRTAACNTDDRVFLVAVEGRTEGATGFRIPEFGQFLQSLGCQEALNLDGGGSTDLVTYHPQTGYTSKMQILDPNGRRSIATSILVGLTEDLRIALRFQQLQETGQELLDKVEKALAEGGSIHFQPGNSGLYKIKEANGKTIAIFKPEDERAFGPANRNPQKRNPDPSEDDIFFHQLSAFHQNKATERQMFALTLDLDGTLLPRGVITTLESDQFFSPYEQGTSKTMTKRGFLTEWVSDSEPLPHGHPASDKFFRDIKPHNPNAIFPQEASQFSNNAVLEQMPLDEYQKHAILNILVYNQDGHANNYLFTRDSSKIPHLISIDLDMILPHKLCDYRGFTSHPRSSHQFTPAALQMITQLNPKFVRNMAQRLGLSEQSCINAQALSTVLKHFSDARLTLAHVHRFISNDSQDQDSHLWKIMVQCEKTAIERLPQVDKVRLNNAKGLRWALWKDGGIHATSNNAKKLKEYRQVHQKRIDGAIERFFWEELDRELEKTIAQLTS